MAKNKGIRNTVIKEYESDSDKDTVVVMLSGRARQRKSSLVKSRAIDKLDIRSRSSSVMNKSNPFQLNTLNIRNSMH